MSFFQDTLSVFKKRELFFLERYKETEDVYTFVFDKEEDLTWKAGQYVLFSITHKKIKNSTKPFTVASASKENIVKITTRIGDNPSDFKKAMLELRQGMKIRMAGPVGSFYIKENKPSLLIAGGIGITPFRSIFKQIEAEWHGVEKQIKLLYINSNKLYLFKDEFTNNSLISVTYLDSRDDLYQEINKFITLYRNDGQYLIAGPKEMVDATSAYIQNNNISKKNIKLDSFFGY